MLANEEEGEKKKYPKVYILENVPFWHINYWLLPFEIKLKGKKKKSAS